MKAIIFTLTTLAILLGSTTDKNVNGLMVDYISSANLKSSSTQIVKATHYKGEVIPVVELLSLDVFGFTDHAVTAHTMKVKTTIVDGERIPTVTLPELDIVANK